MRGADDRRLGDGLSATVSTFAEGRLVRIAASSARDSIGVFFEHVTNLLNMRELEDEGKVMALADYAAPIADRDNPLLPWLRVKDAIITSEWPGHALRRRLARVHWRFPNEQFAYLAQQTVERVVVALARDAVRLTGHRHLALAGGGRIECQGDTSDQAASGRRRCVCLPPHGRWRTAAWSGGDRVSGMR
jgi:carbamoyltransferase